MKSKMNRRILLLLSCIVLAAALSVSGTLAYLTVRTETIINQFEPGRVNGNIEETFENNIKSSIKVQNTGNIDCYVRILLIPYWVSQYGSRVGEDAWKLEVEFNETDWFAREEGGMIYYYHRAPIAPEELTKELLADGCTIQLKASDDGTLYQALDVFAECFQAELPNAVVPYWGVEVDEDGMLIEDNSKEEGL